MKTLGKYFPSASTGEQEQIRSILYNRTMDGYSKVSNAAIMSLLETYKAASLEQWVAFLKDDEAYWHHDHRHLVTQSFNEYCRALDSKAQSLILGELTKLLEHKPLHVRCIATQILGKHYDRATLAERDQILYLLQNQVEDETQSLDEEVVAVETSSPSMVRVVALEALAECFEKENDPEQQNQIFSYLLWWLQDKDLLVRGAAIRALGTGYKNTAEP